jgi:radical SAM protein with 4Fe4S-binding SPASM domain
MPMDDPDARTTPLPARIQVEVTGACNLRCRMCLVAYRPPLSVRRASMTLSRLRRLLDELPDLQELTLQGLGEPLLAPDVFAMIEEAKKRGLRVGFNTNATLLTGARAMLLVELGLDWLHVSVDGASQETFSSIRVGGRLQQVVENLRGLVRCRRDVGSQVPRIQLNTVLMRRNRHELPALVRLAADIGVDRMWIQRLSHDFQDVVEREEYKAIRSFTDDEMLTDEEVASVLDANAALAQDLGLELRLPPVNTAAATTPALRCDWPWSGSYVTHEGRVQPCCMVMGSDRVTLGDLGTESFRSIWQGPMYERFRRDLKGDDPPDVCAGCAVYRGQF